MHSIFQPAPDAKKALTHKPLQEFANVISILAAYRKESKMPPPREIDTLVRAVMTAPGEDELKKYITNWQEMVFREIFTLADEVKAGVADSAAPLLARLAFAAEFSAALPHDKARELIVLVCDTLSTANGSLGEQSVAALVKFYLHIPGDQLEFKKKIVDRLLQICSTHQDNGVKRAALQSLFGLRPILNSDGFYKDIEPVMLAVVASEKDAELIDLALIPLRWKVAEIPVPELEELVKNLCKHVRAGITEISNLDEFCEYIKKPAVLEEVINIVLNQLDIAAIPERKNDRDRSAADAQAQVGNTVRFSLYLLQYINPEVMKNLAPDLIKKIINVVFEKINDPDTNIKEAAVGVLQKFHSLVKDFFPNAELLFKKEIEQLVKLINNKNRNTQWDAIECVGQLCAAGVLSKTRMKTDIMKLCQKENDLRIRVIALNALKQIDAEGAAVEIKAFNDEIMQRCKTIKTINDIYMEISGPKFQAIIYDQEALLHEIAKTCLKTIKKGEVALEVERAFHYLATECCSYLPAALDEAIIGQILDHCTIPSPDAKNSGGVRKYAYVLLGELPLETLKHFKGQALEKLVFSVINETDETARAAAYAALQKIFFESGAKEDVYKWVEAQLKKEPQLTEPARLRGIALLAELRQEAYSQQIMVPPLSDHFPAEVARIVSGYAKRG